MSAKAIREYHGKKLVSKWLPSYSSSVKYDLEDRALLITPNAVRPEDPQSFDCLAERNPWLLETKLVVKPDQLIKRRGKAGLLAINKTWPEVVEWVKERMNKECKVEVVSGILDHFIVEPFVPHKQSDEYYICLQVSPFLPLLLRVPFQAASSLPSMSEAFRLVALRLRLRLSIALLLLVPRCCQHRTTHRASLLLFLLLFGLGCSCDRRASVATTRSSSTTRAALMSETWMPRACACPWSWASSPPWRA